MSMSDCALHKMQICSEQTIPAGLLNSLSDWFW